MRNTSVVTKAAKEPTPRVMKDGNLDVPFDPRRSIKSDVSRVRKVSPAADNGELDRIVIMIMNDNIPSGWSTRTPVVVRDIRSRSSSAFL